MTEMRCRIEHRPLGLMLFSWLHIAAALLTPPKTVHHMTFWGGGWQEDLEKLPEALITASSQFFLYC